MKADGMNGQIRTIFKTFQIEGKIEKAVPYGNGVINDTYLVECSENIRTNRYILQRINTSVFKDPVSLMDNILRITGHIRRKLEQEGISDIDRRVLRVILTNDNRGCSRDAEGGYWRAYRYIENVRSWDYLDHYEQAYEAARMFGWFQRSLSDLPGAALSEIIPDFHNTPKRLKDFMAILDEDPYNRADLAKTEIQFILSRPEICDRLLNLVMQGQIPERVTHNDTKINNVLFDTVTEEGVCVIDLDTVMPGLSLYDFGDMVRTATCRAAEDERDLSKIQMDLKFFEQIAKGYAKETVAFLTEAEKEHLAFAGKLITFEQMIRFLSDYLNGDLYYKTTRPSHNLDRARTQMKLVQSIEAQEDCMQELTEAVWKQYPMLG